MQCFHHDDLDDLCITSAFVKSFQKHNNDFLEAFDLANPEKSKYPNITKLLTLSTREFASFWLKGSQMEYMEDEKLKETRDVWIRENLIAKDAKKDKEIDREGLTKSLEEVAGYKQRLESARVEFETIEKKFKNNIDRGRPSEEDFDDKPDMLHSFKLAYTQFETSKEVLLPFHSIPSIDSFFLFCISSSITYRYIPFLLSLCSSLPLQRKWKPKPTKPFATPKSSTSDHAPRAMPRTTKPSCSTPTQSAILPRRIKD